MKMNILHCYLASAAFELCSTHRSSMCGALWLCFFNKRQIHSVISVSQGQHGRIFSNSRRMIKKLLFHQGKRSLEIYRELEGKFRNNAPSKQTARKWFLLIQEGRTIVEDYERLGIPSEASHLEMVQRVELLLVRDCRQTWRSWQRGLTSPGSIHTILLRDLDKQKKSANGSLTDVWLKKSVISERQSPDHTYRRNSGLFLDLETKAQSVEWHSRGYPRTQKAIRKQSPLKVMQIMALTEDHSIDTKKTRSEQKSRIVFLQTKASSNARPS